MRLFYREYEKMHFQLYKEDVYELVKGEEEFAVRSCSMAQPGTAALQVLSLLAEAGYLIRYIGDMDPEGIDIADRLWKRFGQMLEIRRMSPEDYRSGHSEERIDDLQA